MTGRVNENMKSRRFAVIGAGAAGLCSAKYLIENGFDNVTIFEIGSQIGGLWCYENDNGLSSAYKTLHINTARDLTNFSDFKFDKDVQLFPDHRDMHRYLVSYAEHFDLVRRIRFNTRVVDVRQDKGYSRGNPKWEVELDNGEIALFDRVIVANGHLATPQHIPEFQNNFKGEYLHSHYYREPEPFSGKTICVVGVGNSACDIASDVCVNSPRTVMVARSGVVIVPKLVFGVPFTDIAKYLFKKWVPAWVRKKIIAFLVYLIHGKMTNLGFKPQNKRTHITSNAVVVQHIAYRRIIVKQGIDRIEGKHIFFPDGSSDEFDVLIAATGYRIDIPFIAQSLLPVKENAVDLYKRISAPGIDGMYFMGLLNTTTALNLIFENQARWICAIETGDAVLPEPDEMRADIETKKNWIRSNYKESLRHTIEEDHMIYLGELAKSMKAGRHRAAGIKRSGSFSGSLARESA